MTPKKKKKKKEKEKKKRKTKTTQTRRIIKIVRRKLIALNPLLSIKRP